MVGRVLLLTEWRMLTDTLGSRSAHVQTKDVRAHIHTRAHTRAPKYRVRSPDPISGDNTGSVCTRRTHTQDNKQAWRVRDHGRTAQHPSISKPLRMSPLVGFSLQAGLHLASVFITKSDYFLQPLICLIIVFFPARVVILIGKRFDFVCVCVFVSIYLHV